MKDLRLVSGTHLFMVFLKSDLFGYVCAEIIDNLKQKAISFLDVFSEIYLCYPYLRNIRVKFSS